MVNKDVYIAIRVSTCGVQKMPLGQNVPGQNATEKNATRLKCHKPVNVKDKGPHVVGRLGSGLASSVG